MKTIGGYTIRNFTILPMPMEKNCRTFHYQGVIEDCWIADVKTHWDEEGRCTNLSREDCFINLDDVLKMPFKENSTL